MTKMTEKELCNILFLCNLPADGADANTIRDHIEAFDKFSTHKMWMYSNIGEIAASLDLNHFDVIIIHYSMCLLNNYYISEKSKLRIRAFNGLKIVFVQDEYRQINALIAQLSYLKIDVLFTCFSETEMEKIYSKALLPKLRKYNTLTGYVPSALCDSRYHPSMEKRKIHVGYRARKLPFWYGELAFEKWDIVNRWKANVNDSEIVTDISYHETDRLYGKNWINFLTSCKTMLGVESGASVMDFTGELEKILDAHQMRYPNDSFQNVQKHYLQPHEGRYKLNQISPRCFEAIALKTVLVLYEGEYSGILIPNRHYIELKKDFSNIADVIKKIKDDSFLQHMSDLAYNEIALNPCYSYEAFIERFDHIVKVEFDNKNKKKRFCAYNDMSFKKAISTVSLSVKVKKHIKRVLLYIKTVKENFWLNAKNELRKQFKRFPPSIQSGIKKILRPKKCY